MESIHGHEVMQLIADSTEARSQAGWIAAIGEKFGADARFHTCSAENLSAPELLQFLAERGKFAEQAGGITLDASEICDH